MIVLHICLKNIHLSLRRHAAVGRKVWDLKKKELYSRENVSVKNF